MIIYMYQFLQISIMERASDFVLWEGKEVSLNQSVVLVCYPQHAGLFCLIRAWSEFKTLYSRVVIKSMLSIRSTHPLCTDVQNFFAPFWKIKWTWCIAASKYLES